MLISWDKDGGHLNGPVDLQLQLSPTAHVNVEIRAAEREGGGSAHLEGPTSDGEIT